MHKRKEDKSLAKWKATWHVQYIINNVGTFNINIRYFLVLLIWIWSSTTMFKLYSYLRFALKGNIGLSAWRSVEAVHFSGMFRSSLMFQVQEYIRIGSKQWKTKNFSIQSRNNPRPNTKNYKRNNYEQIMKQSEANYEKIINETNRWNTSRPIKKSYKRNNQNEPFYEKNFRGQLQITNETVPGKSRNKFRPITRHLFTKQLRANHENIARKSRSFLL